MEIILANKAGFCFGVERAVNQVHSEREKATEPIYTYGPIIHNKEVVKELERNGVYVLSEEDSHKPGHGMVVLRSHGVSRQVQEELVRNGYEISDATCPFVKKIHRIVSEKSSEGYNILIAGNPRHPEVISIMGWCNGPVKAVQSVEELEQIPEDFLKKVCVVAQTTFNFNKFNILVAKLQKTMYDILVFNSICNATKERQVEAAQLAGTVDCMLVVGDTSSSNTQKLYEICQQQCANTHLVQTAEELDVGWLEGAKRVGITAGASTPHNIIEEVQTKCQI